MNKIIKYATVSLFLMAIATSVATYINTISHNDYTQTLVAMFMTAVLLLLVYLFYGVTESKK